MEERCTYPTIYTCKLTTFIKQMYMTYQHNKCNQLAIVKKTNDFDF